MLDNTWSIEDLDTGKIHLTNHIEIKTPIQTLEKSIEGKGFGMITEGVLVHKEHPSIGKFIVIVKEEGV